MGQGKMWEGGGTFEEADTKTSALMGHIDGVIRRTNYTNAKENVNNGVKYCE